FQLNERHVAIAVVAIAIAGHATLDEDWPAEFFKVGRDVESVEPVIEVGDVAYNLFGDRDDIESARDGIDNRRAANAKFRTDKPVCDARKIGSGVQGIDLCAWVDETHLPKRRTIGSVGIVGVKSINRIVLGRGEDDVVHLFARDCYIGQNERLSYRIAV